MLNRFTAVTAAMLIAAAGAMAQEAKKPEKKQPPKEQQPAASLKVGDKAPALSVETWVKGDKVEKFDSGKVYVVEFWATWCGPCIQNIPHLTKTQKEFKDKGVTIIGVAASERGAGATVLSDLKKFVREKGDQMAYTVGYDSDRSMWKAWMEPAGQGGIPHAFVIGKDGKVAWHGHPAAGLEDAIKKAVGGGKAAIDGPSYNTVLVGQPEKKDKEAKPATDKQPKMAKPVADPDATLFVGDKAPELGVGKWVKGEQVTGFEKGKTYVVEFWATWCGPCKKSIPHITELQAANKNVKFIGVSIWESDQKEVEPFVKEMGDKMGYTVAMDDIPANAEADSGKSGKMAKTWMTAADQHSIPTAFIINGEGKVAWIGHPMEMEEPLAKISEGKWDLSKEASEAHKKYDVAKKLKPLQRKQASGQATGDADAELAAIDEIIPLDPNAVSQATGEPLLGRKFALLLTEKKDAAKAYAFGNEAVTGAAKDNWMALNQIAWTIVDPAAVVENKDLKLAVQAAQRAYDIVTDKKNPLGEMQIAMVADTLAKATFDSGDITKALELQEKAADLAKGTRFEKEISDRLKEFREAAKKKGG